LFKSKKEVYFAFLKKIGVSWYKMFVTCYFWKGAMETFKYIKIGYKSSLFKNTHVFLNDLNKYELQSC
jgi:hypothetical protein